MYGYYAPETTKSSQPSGSVAHTYLMVKMRSARVGALVGRWIADYSPTTLGGWVDLHFWHLNFASTASRYCAGTLSFLPQTTHVKI